MSLLDALLLDPYRINVWIAYRTDGVNGTGTQNDPWDGSTATKLDTVLNITIEEDFRLKNSLRFAAGCRLLQFCRSLLKTVDVDANRLIRCL